MGVKRTMADAGAEAPKEAPAEGAEEKKEDALFSIVVKVALDSLKDGGSARDRTITVKLSSAVWQLDAPVTVMVAVPL